MMPEKKSLRIFKKKLYNDVQPMSEREFRDTINPIIAKNRGVALTDAKKVRIIQHLEVLMFLAKIGEDVNNYSLEAKKEKAAA